MPHRNRTPADQITLTTSQRQAQYPANGEAPLIAFELLQHPSGPAVPVAFTTLEKLVAALGPAQPWLASSIGPFTEAMRDAGLPMVHLDPVIEPGHHNWTPQDLEEYARKVS